LAATVPLVHDFGPLALIPAFAAFATGATLGLRLSRRLERRADKLAREQQAEEGAYARALTKIYEANLAPLVEPGKGTTHPHLYDRLVAAGAPPDSPRPRPPARSRLLIDGLPFALILAAWVGLMAAPVALVPRGQSER